MLLTQTLQVNDLQNAAIINDANVYVKADGKANNGLMYGGLVNLHASTDQWNSLNSHEVSVYTKGMFGAFKLGNMHGASKDMTVNAANFAAATGGIAGKTHKWWNEAARSTETTLVLVLQQVVTAGTLVKDVIYYNSTFTNKCSFI